MILYLFAEIKCHNCYYSVCMKLKHSNLLCYLTIRLARHLCSSTPLVYLYICMDVCMSFCTLTLCIFVFAPHSTTSQTSLNRILRFSDHYRITLEIELFTALNCFEGAVKTQTLMGAPFLIELVDICHSYKPYSTAFTGKFIVH